MRLSRISLMLLLAATFVLLSPAQAEQKVLRLATTTSTENSGLLKSLLPAFEKNSGYKVHVIAVGTGKALRMGQDGDVDVVMVHARMDEDKFVAAGYGINRRDLMYNDFVIVGPKRDPAGIGAVKDPAAALARIAAAKEAAFISRGDESGTYKKEQALWQAADIKPQGKWYRSIGQGMEQALQIASEMQGYTLADRGTWLALRKKLDLVILVQGDNRLFNPYGVIAVNPARYPDVNYQGAMAFIAWLTSPGGQNQIAAFKIDGENLFFPDAIQAKQASPK
ncbi:MAG TPA: extracellular solute-binding protein [Sulfuricaulis sp.]|nr:extracellular solute-binding protein [Sulfuricaulis sp.]